MVINQDVTENAEEIIYQVCAMYFDWDVDLDMFDDNELTVNADNHVFDNLRTALNEVDRGNVDFTAFEGDFKLNGNYYPFWGDYINSNDETLDEVFDGSDFSDTTVLLSDVLRLFIIEFYHYELNILVNMKDKTVLSIAGIIDWKSDIIKNFGKK